MTDSKTATERLTHVLDTIEPGETVDMVIDMTDSKTATELNTIVEALEKLALAVAWTMPNDSASVRAYLTEALDAIGKLKELIPDDR